MRVSGSLTNWLTFASGNPFRRAARIAAVTLLMFVGANHVESRNATACQDASVPPSASTDDSQTEKLPTPVRAYKRLLQSTVYLQFLKEEPTGTHRYRGTGWVIDRERRLVITNQHVVQDEAEVTAWCPAYKDGEVIGMLDHYFNQVPGTRAVVIDRDRRRDLALLQLDHLTDEMVALPLAPKSPSPGEKVFTLGAWPDGSEGMWIFTAGEVRSVYDRRHANGFVCRVVETQLPTNRGNSGGPVINDKGELVAVVEGHDTDARLVSVYIAVEEVVAYMEELKDLAEPKTADAFYQRGDRRFYEGQYRQAAADYTSCLRLDATRLDALTSRGWCQYHLGDYSTALLDFDEALKRDAEFAEGYFGRGVCYYMKDQSAEARDSFTNAIRRDADNDSYYRWRGEANFNLGELPAALSDLNEAVKLNANGVDNRITRARIHRNMANYQAALEDGRAAIQLDKTDYRGFQEAALALRSLGELERAIVVFAGAIELAPQVWDLYLGRGNCYQESGQTENAIKDYVKSIELNEENPYSYWGLGLIMRDAQDWERAIAFFTRCIELDPGDPDYYEQRATCYDAVGNTQAAAQDRAKMKQLKK